MAKRITEIIIKFQYVLRELRRHRGSLFIYGCCRKAMVEHDMWEDYNHYQNTGEPDVFDEEDIDEIVDELNDWD